MTDKVFFEDRNGTRIGPYKTKFGADRITVFQDELQVAEGDRVIQPLADGSEQAYLVDGVAYGAARRNVPGHFSITIKKEAASSAPGTPAMRTALNESVSDQAGNNEHAAALVRSLATGIENANFPREQRDEARRLLETLIAHPVVAAVLGGA
ncbi:hypothetical protein AYR66_27330 [Noviherbaspirillum denitrificans]|uniref:Uncharacterized protein n=2 Tax=Noviherbaspirillum denitrificans TaxID=1968433 RepID=A0A254TJ51_9BURK|nr:hypothetical protein AYR66_27330 [Noviherbaspirillum denitrificans]